MDVYFDCMAGSKRPRVGRYTMSDDLTFLHLSEADLSRWREDPVTVLLLKHLLSLRDAWQAECLAQSALLDARASVSAGRAAAFEAVFNNCTVSRIKEDLVTTDHTFVDPRLKKVRKHGQTDAQ